MSDHTERNSRPLGFGRGARILGLGVCALLLVAACSTEIRNFGEGGGGGTTTGSTATGGKGGTGTTTSSGGGGSSSSGTPCQTSDPDCECVNDQVVARDVDNDLHGSRLCEENPGDDCDDGDGTFVVNDCGGCNKNLGGKVGDPCQGCERWDPIACGAV